MPVSTIDVLDSAGVSRNLNAANSNGQALMAASRPVVIASDQSAVPVSGTITANAGSGTMAVSLASLPALATGGNVIGGVTQSGTWNIGTVTTVTTVSTVTNLAQFGGAAINLGAGAVGTGTLRTTQASDSPLVTATGAIADAAWASGSGSLVALLKTIAGAALDTTTASPVKIDQTTDGTTNRVNAVPGSTAHALIPAPSTYRVLSAAASTNGANIKGSSGTVKGIQGFNAKASAVYLKLYNKATAPTVGTDTPVKTIYLPASAAFAFDFGTGVAFATGIGIALTGAGADADTTALASGDVLALNVDYH